jgi:YHS domain-containing protein
MIARTSERYEPRVPATIVKDVPHGDEANEPIVGLDGYSPIVLMEERKWIKGKSGLVHTYQGVTYRFQSEAELRRFADDPARFAPRLLGCDPVELWLSDRALRGNTRFGAYFDGQLYLFLTHENRETFKDNPLRYTETRHVLKTSDIVLR